MSYMDVKRGAFIDYENGRWAFERRQGEKLEWRNVNTYEHRQLTDLEVQRLLRKGELKLFDGYGKPPAEGNASRIHGLRAHSKEDWEEAKRRLLYVQAIHDAKLFKPGTSVADWDREIAHIHRTYGFAWQGLRGKNKGIPVPCPCYKTVYRWVKAGGPRPTQEKLLPAHRFKGDYSDRLEEDLRAFIMERVEQHYLKRPPITLDGLMTIILVELKKENQQRAQTGIPPMHVPGVKAVLTSIARFPQDEVLRRRYGEMAAFLRYGSAAAQKDPEAPLDVVELDSTPCDLFVVDPESGLPIGRPTLVVAIDRCTRMVVGWFVTFEKPSVLSLMQCLKHAILSKDYLEEIREANGWNIVNPCETFGVPRTIRVDRGRENIAGHLAQFAVKAGVNRVEITGGKKPWLKGAVERVIKTLSERLLHPSKGTTFHNVLQRMGYDPLKDAVCTMADLDYALHKFFIDIYPFERHRGLNNRQPIKVWRELTRKSPVSSIGSIEDVAHLFGRTETASVGRHGINYESLQFVSTELLDMIRLEPFKQAIANQGGTIEFHVDPGALSEIHVRIPHQGGRILTVPVAPKWTKYATGLSLWHHRRIREFASDEAKKDADQLLQAKYELMELMRQTGWAKKGSLRARGMTTRMEGANRFSRAGTDASTSKKQIAPDHPETVWAKADIAEPAAEPVQSRKRSPAPSTKPVVTTNDHEPEYQDLVPEAETTATNINGSAVVRRERRGYRP